MQLIRGLFLTFLSEDLEGALTHARMLPDAALTMSVLNSLSTKLKQTVAAHRRWLGAAQVRDHGSDGFVLTDSI
jgi:hypothetical protein